MKPAKGQFERIKDAKKRAWYARAAVDRGGSRTVLDVQIESRLRRRRGKAIANFSRTLPRPQSELAQQL